jgi:RsiW-degrading membrane proteinase PrsW (M82 family)
MEFKQLDIKQENNPLKAEFWTKHRKKSAIYILLGAIFGMVYLYFSESKSISSITSGELVKSMLVGGFFGFFITNSPCARGKC